MADRNIQWDGWEIGERIGKGGFGSVYEIRRDVFGDVERKALKVITIPRDDSEVEYLRCGGMDDDGITNTFYSQVGDIIGEYKMMSKLQDNPNIVHCDDFRYNRHENGLGWDIYIKMELLTPLMKAIDKVQTEEEIIRLGKELCNALVDCQRLNLIHRDIKPQNIFISPNGIFKLGDFGIARVAEHTTKATAGAGTISFMAPEVANGKRYGTTVDIYSLGLVLYWLLNECRGPFLPLPPVMVTYTMTEEATRMRRSGALIPAPKNGSRELKAVVLKACSFDPADRYQTAKEMLSALEQIGKGVAWQEEEDETVVSRVLPIKPYVPKKKRATEGFDSEEDVTRYEASTPGNDSEVILQDADEKKRNRKLKENISKSGHGDDNTKEKKQNTKKLAAYGLAALTLVILAAVGLLLYMHQINAPDETLDNISVVALEEYRDIVANYGLPVYTYPDEVREFGKAEVYATNFGGAYSKWPDQECMVVYYAIHPDHEMALNEENVQLSMRKDAIAKWGITDNANQTSAQGTNYSYTEIDDTELGYRYLVNCIVDNITIRIVASRTYKEDAQILLERLVFGLQNDRNAVGPENMSLWTGNTFVADWLTNPETGEEIQKDQVLSVTFVGTLADAPQDSWDISSAKDRTVLAWAIPNGKVFDIYIGAEGGVNADGRCKELFKLFSKLERVSFNDAFHTDYEKDMSAMFTGCYTLRSISLKGLDTSNVTSMAAMFSGCLELTTLDLDGVSTANVTSMSSMFGFCTKLESLDLAGFDTAKVRSMRSMFESCSGLTSLDLGSFNTANVVDMGNMFEECRNLISLDISGLNTSNVTNMSNMFRSCESLRELNINNFDTSNVISYYNFYDKDELAGIYWRDLFEN